MPRIVSLRIFLIYLPSFPWFFLLFFWFALSAPFLWADSLDDSNRTQPLPLKPLTVKATRSFRTLDEIPASVQHVEPSAIHITEPPVTLDELLGVLPGLFFSNPFNFAQDLRLSIRGFGMRAPFGIRGIKVLVDGIPETLPDGQTQVDVIDPGMIDHMEVMRGPSSSLYGNASGGVLAVTTQGGPEEGLIIQPELRFGEFGMIKNQIQWGENQKSFRFNLYASRFQWNGFRKHSETEQSLVRGKFRFSRDPRTKWLFTIGHFNSPRAKDPGGLTQGEVEEKPDQSAPQNITFDAGERVQQQNFGIYHHRKLSDRIEMSVTVYLIRREFSNKLPFENGGMVAFERYAPGGGVQWIREGQDGAHRLILGIDSATQRDVRERFNNLQGERGQRVFEQRERVTSIGPYLRSEWKVMEEWVLAFGIRYDHLWFGVDDFYLTDGDQSGNRTLAEWSGTLGVVYHWKSSTHLFGNIATGFETPTTTELLNNPSGEGGFNLNLDSQYSVNYEIGVKRTSVEKSLDYELSLFYITSQDELISFQLPAFPSRSFFRNAGETQRRGIEIDLNYHPVKQWNARFSYTFSDFEFVRLKSDGQSLAGKSLPGLPEHRLFAQVDYQSTLGFFGEWNIQYVDAIPVNNENLQNSPSYILSNIRLGREGRLGAIRWSAILGLNNILDESYNANVRINAANERFFEPAPPFNVFGGFSLMYATG